MRPLIRALFFGVLSVTAGCGAGDAAPSISDREFSSAADDLCSERLPPLRADISDDAPREPAEVAPTVAARAESLDALVGELRQLPIRSAARPEVDAWLADWDDYIDVGRRYSEALKQGDPQGYSSVAEEGEVPQARISAFARANGLTSCALDGVPLPPREGL